MKHAVIETGGKQYRVAEGDVIYVEKLDAEAGATVKAGDVIGQVGTSATSEVADGAHVHFEVIKSGTRVDPADYLLSSDE